MPFFWPRAAQKLLPGTAERLLTTQQTSLCRDWEQVQSRYPQIAWDDYVHAWFVVSTRAFYQETPQTLPYPELDRLALLPVADLFNHAVTGCKVSKSDDGYCITADREYLRGEPVHLSYGDHSNDFLLAEYGFLLQYNTNDRFDPEDLISPEFSAEETAPLRQMKDLAALRQVCGPPTREDTLADEGRLGNISGAVDNVRMSELLSKLLEEIEKYHSATSALGDNDQGCQTLLLQRWDQIGELVREASWLST